jgi:uncharacterized surface protein with fasciclin (FAS1) repeats
LVVPNYDSTGTAEYIVKAYTINKSYNWSVEGATLQDTTRGGEVAIVSAADSSVEYTVSVTTTVDGQEVSGSASGAAKYPDASAQLTKYNNLSTFQSVASTAGVSGILGNRDTTALIPTSAAFLDRLDADGDTTISDAEMPDSGVLAQILQYHVIPGETLRSADISNGQTVTTAFGGDLTFNTGGNLTVDGDASSAAYVAPDIATDGPALLRIDGVLLPSAAASINDQTATEGPNTDTVDVAGVYLSNGGFIVLHEASSGNVIGNSDYLDPGFYGNTGPVPVALDSELSADTTEVVAMPHRDNGDMVYGFPGTDGPYTYTSGGAPVTDTASVVAP